jgi:16S rRNA processing protein RimM
MDKDNALICLGKITKPHGIRGYVKVFSYTQNPSDIINYGPLYDQSGEHTYKVKIISTTQDLLVVAIDGIDSRTKAEELSGTELYVSRDRLPEPDEDEFYYVDLVGLDVYLAGDKENLYGTVKAFHNFGAGDLVEITLASGADELLSFDALTVPYVDIDEGYIIVAPPEKQFVNANDNSSDESE